MNTGLDKFSILIILGLLVLHQLDVSPVFVGIVAGAAALAHAARLLQWHSLRPRRDPLVWMRIPIVPDTHSDYYPDSVPTFIRTFNRG